MSDTDPAPDQPRALTRYQPRPDEVGDYFRDPLFMEHTQRAAISMAGSQMIPEHFRGKEHISDILVAIDLAHRLRLTPIMVLQNMYLVKGTPGWKSQFLTALANNAGWDLDYEIRSMGPDIKYKRKAKDGTVDAVMPAMGVRCVMVRGSITKRGMEVTSAQAIAARWADNEQYTHSAEQMLCYRAAAFAIRRHDSNLMLGLPTREELEDAPPPEPIQAVVVSVDPQPTRGSAAVDAALKPARNPHDGATAENDAATLRATLGDFKAPVNLDATKARLRDAMGYRSLTDARYHAAVAHGEGAGLWYLHQGSIFPGRKPPPPAPQTATPGGGILDQVRELQTEVGHDRATAILDELQIANVEHATTEQLQAYCDRLVAEVTFPDPPAAPAGGGK